MGLGAYPGNDKQFIQMLGMHGSYEANMAMHDCDLMIAIGARFDDRITGRLDMFSPNSKKIHIDIDPSSISKNIRVDVSVIGDVKKVLSLLIKVSRKINLNIQTLNYGGRKLKHGGKKIHFHTSKTTKLLNLQFVVDKLYEVTNGEAFITSDVGQHQMWAAQLYKYKYPKRWINSGGLVPWDLACHPQWAFKLQIQIL